MEKGNAIGSLPDDMMLGRSKSETGMEYTWVIVSLHLDTGARGSRDRQKGVRGRDHNIAEVSNGRDL